MQAPGRPLRGGDAMGRALRWSCWVSSPARPARLLAHRAQGGLLGTWLCDYVGCSNDGQAPGYRSSCPPGLPLCRCWGLWAADPAALAAHHSPAPWPQCWQNHPAAATAHRPASGRAAGANDITTGAGRLYGLWAVPRDRQEPSQGLAAALPLCWACPSLGRRAGSPPGPPERPAAALPPLRLDAAAAGAAAAALLHQAAARCSRAVFRWPLVPQPTPGPCSWQWRQQ